MLVIAYFWLTLNSVAFGPVSAPPPRSPPPFWWCTASSPKLIVFSFWVNEGDKVLSIYVGWSVWKIMQPVAILVLHRHRALHHLCFPLLLPWHCICFVYPPSFPAISLLQWINSTPFAHQRIFHSTPCSRTATGYSVELRLFWQARGALERVSWARPCKWKQGKSLAGGQ